MTKMNRQFRLAKRPSGMVSASDFSRAESPVEAPGDGEALVQTRFLSLDPAMRGWMNEGKSYVPPVGIGEVMRAGGIGEVLESSDAALQPGDTVVGMLGVQTLGTHKSNSLRKVDPALATLPKYLGVLGMPGMTAYFGLLDVGQPKAGDTVVVSGAAGAVGQLVGQIAKLKGCRVVGIAGGAKKCEFARKELGFDECLDHRAGDLRAELKRACPDGIDVYFDNVGGEILDLVLARLKMKARVVICGAISQYNNAGPMKGPANYMSLLVNRARMEGFVVFDYAKRYGEAVHDLAQWMKDGKLQSREHVVSGFDRFPEALLMLFSGANHGKLVLDVEPQ